MDEPTKPTELPAIPPLKARRLSQVSNYSYPRPESPFFFIPQYEVRRGSAGSDCSMPGMIEDQGSDVSIEDDYQSQAAGADLWDSFWQARVHEELGGGRQYPALLETPVPSTSQEGQRDRAGSQITQRDSTWPLPLATSPPNKRKTKVPPPPRASYSLFPSKNGCPPTTPPRRSSLPKGESTETHSQSPASPTKPKKVSMVSATKKTAETIQAPRPAPRRPLPATPRPQKSARTITILTASSLHTKPLPKTPDEWRRSTRRVSGTNQHKRSISRTPTQSLPLLSSTVQRKTTATVATTATPPYKHQYSQSQTFHVSRPVPPAPRPQNVSVFEFSDDEDDEDTAAASGDEIRGLARRLVRGLTQHRDRNGHAKAQQVQARLASFHQRSVSDNSPSTITTTMTNAGGSRPNPWERSGAAGTTTPGTTVGLAMLRPSTSAGVIFSAASSDGAGTRRQSNLKESRSRPWLSRQGSELFFGRLLGRRVS